MKLLYIKRDVEIVPIGGKRCLKGLSKSRTKVKYEIIKIKRHLKTNLRTKKHRRTNLYRCIQNYIKTYLFYLVLL